LDYVQRGGVMSANIMDQRVIRSGSHPENGPTHSGARSLSFWR
jgi:hypothetical protein